MRGEPFRLLDYSPTGGVVQADLAGQTLRYRVGAPGEHMALNSLAVLAAVTMQGLDLAPALERLGNAAPLPGRGARVARVFDGKPVEVLDEAYNANPASMEAALRLLAAQAPHGGRRLLVLGDMLELGPDAPQYHAALAPAVQAARADRIYLLRADDAASGTGTGGRRREGLVVSGGGSPAGSAVRPLGRATSC